MAYKYLSIASMELLERGLIAEALKLSVDVHPMMRAAKDGLSHQDFISPDATSSKFSPASPETEENGRKCQSAQNLDSLCERA